MLETLKMMLLLFGACYTDIIPMVAIMVSVIIAVIGFFKPFIFNRIRNKKLRKGALAIANMALSFTSSFLYFAAEGWNLKYYVLASVALWLTCIITYYLYETVPYVRDFIGGLGTKAIRKLFNVALLALSNDDPEAVKTEVKTVTPQLKTTAKTELKKAATKVKIDKDLVGL